jgi:hypothetical protein
MRVLCPNLTLDFAEHIVLREDERKLKICLNMFGRACGHGLSLDVGEA